MLECADVRAGTLERQADVHPMVDEHATICRMQQGDDRQVAVGLAMGGKQGLIEADKIACCDGAAGIILK